MEDLSYPIGKFQFPRRITSEDLKKWLGEIAGTPRAVREAVAGLSEAQLDTRYRPGGWTVRQVVHHLVDSHINAYIRLRLAQTEETPTIRPYDQDRSAALADSATGPVDVSLDLLETLHRRWVMVVESLSEEEMKRAFFHPELDTNVSIETLLAMYAWHGNHHVAHITRLREREGW